MPLGISVKCSSIAPSATLSIDAKAKALKAQGIDVVTMAAGEPDFDTPVSIRNAMKEAMDKGLTHYGPVAGLPELRNNICTYLKKNSGVRYEADEVIVSNGAKHSLYILFQTILNPGDEVIIPTPCWVSYPEMIRMAGGVPIFVEGKEENAFIPTLSDIEACVSTKTKAFVLNNPSNPSGCVWSREALLALGKLAVQKDFYLISDEIYAKLVYGDAEAVSVPSLGEDIKANTILISGVSKTFAMTGFRIGFTAGPKAVIKGMSTYQSQSTSAPNTAAMYAAAVAFGNPPEEEMKIMHRAFEQRRDLLVDGIKAIPGLSCDTPRGAFYLLVNHKGLIGKKIDGKTIEDSASFAALLLEYAHVAVVPGNAFMAEGYCRLSYAISTERIKEALKRIAEFAKELKA